MSIGGSRYIPTNVIAFCAWVKIVLAYAAQHCTQWGVEAPGEHLVTLLTKLTTLANLCTTSKCTAENKVERNMLHKELEREIRGYLQGFVMRNPHITNLDRTAMGLPLRDTKPTPVGDPAGLVTATVKYPNEGALELHIEHVESTPFDKRANYGVKIVYDVLPVGAPAPAHAEQLQRSLFTRRKKELLTFGDDDSRKVAWFRLRYENSKGKAGQWGPIFSAVIP